MSLLPDSVDPVLGSWNLESGFLRTCIVTLSAPLLTICLSILSQISVDCSFYKALHQPYGDQYSFPRLPLRPWSVDF